MHQHGERVVTDASVGVDHHLTLHVKSTDATPFGDVARRKHHLGRVKGVGNGVVGERDLGSSKQHVHLSRAIGVVRNGCLNAQRGHLERLGHRLPQRWRFLVFTHGAPRLGLGKRVRKEHQLAEFLPLGGCEQGGIDGRVVLGKPLLNRRLESPMRVHR